MLTVIGVGNRLRGDDAVGPALIEELTKQQLPDLELIDAGADALGVLEYFENRDSVIIVDACRMDQEPGEVKCFDSKKARLFLAHDQLSLHGLGLAEALKMAETLRILPASLKIIGIEPLSLQLGGELSKPVQQALKIAADYVYLELQKVGEPAEI